MTSKQRPEKAEGASHAGLLRGNCPSRENSKDKCPEVEPRLRNSMKASLAGAHTVNEREKSRQ